MTFRSFSRFVRWYRWELRTMALGVALCCSWLALGPSCGAAGIVLGSTVLITSPVIALFRSDPDKGGEWPGRVLARRQRRRWRAESDERARLRSLPLRGWTK